jgi:spore maturation protein SpmA
MKKREKTTTKLIVWFLVINSVAWTWCSYILAWFGRVDIAETLSKTVVTEVISVFALYSVKALFENISKNTTAFGENVKQIKDNDRDC